MSTDGGRPKEKETTMKLGVNGVSVGKQQGQKPLKERRKGGGEEIRKHFLPREQFYLKPMEDGEDIKKWPEEMIKENENSRTRRAGTNNI